MGIILMDRGFRDARIKIMGIGGGGSNAVDYMVRRGLPTTLTIAANTDKQALARSSAEYKLQAGKEVTQGLGAGGDPEVGERAMREAAEEVRQVLSNADMVFLTAGMGGGTGTGGIQVAAEICQEMGILTVAVVTLPFSWEGPKRMEIAREWLKRLEDKVDTLLVIPNDKLQELFPDMEAVHAFEKSNEVLYEAVSGIVDIIVTTGLINVDFADVRKVMQMRGRAVMGSGLGEGENRAKEAARASISSPLLERMSIRGAKGILVNITHGPDLKMAEITEITSFILEEARDGKNKPLLIFGDTPKKEMNGKVKVTVIATGIEQRQRAWDPWATPADPWSAPPDSPSELFGDDQF